jgi:hypothetical protein
MLFLHFLTHKQNWYYLLAAQRKKPPTQTQAVHIDPAHSNSQRNDDVGEN